MKFMNCLAGVCAVCFLGMAAIRPAQAQPATASAPASQPAHALERSLFIGQDLNGEEVTAFIGQQILVSLPGNPTTGYQWSIKSLAGDSVRQTGKLEFVPFKTPEPNMVGAGGRYNAGFEAIKPGPATLQMYYTRPWEKDDPLAESFTLTFAVQPDPTPARTELLKANLGTFTMQINFVGQTDKPLYQLFLSTAPIAPVKQPNPFNLQAQITEQQAGKIVDFLAAEGFLRRASDSTNVKMLNVFLPEFSAYTLIVRGGPTTKPVQYFHGLGFDLATLSFLERFKTVLDGKPADDLGQLLARLAGYRQEWQKVAASQPANGQ